MGLYSELLIPIKDLGRAGREAAAWQQGVFPADNAISNECLHGGGFPLAQQGLGKPGRRSREGTTLHQQSPLHHLSRTRNFCFSLQAKMMPSYKYQNPSSHNHILFLFLL